MLALLALWGGVSAGELASVLRRLPPSLFAAAFALHLLIYVARAMRFGLLLPAAERPPLAAMLPISAAHNLAAYVLPAKSGEATFVLYLKALRGVPARSSLASLLVSRLLDLASLSAALAAAVLALTLGGRWSAPPWAGSGLAVLLLFASAAFVALGARGDRVLGLAPGILRLLRLERTVLGRRLLEHGELLGQSLRSAGGAHLAAAAALSLAIWTMAFVFYAMLARGFGLPDQIGFAEATFGSALAVVTNLLPINAIAGFGTQETGWVLGFGLLGVERELAFSSGLGAHLVQLANVCLLGLLGHLAMGILPRAGLGESP